MNIPNLLIRKRINKEENEELFLIDEIKAVHFSLVEKLIIKSDEELKLQILEIIQKCENLKDYAIDNNLRLLYKEISDISWFWSKRYFFITGQMEYKYIGSSVKDIESSKPKLELKSLFNNQMDDYISEWFKTDPKEEKFGKDRFLRIKNKLFHVIFDPNPSYPNWFLNVLSEEEIIEKYKSLQENVLNNYVSFFITKSGDVMSSCRKKETFLKEKKRDLEDITITGLINDLNKKLISK